MATPASTTTTIQPFAAQNVQSWEVWHPRTKRERPQVVTLIRESTGLIHDLAVRVQSYLYFPTCALSLSEDLYQERPVTFSVQELHPVDFNRLTLSEQGSAEGCHAPQIQNLMWRHHASRRTRGNARGNDLIVAAFERQGLTVSTYFTLPVEERQKRAREQYAVQLTNAEQITEAAAVRVVIPQSSFSREMFLNLVFSPEHQERGVLTQLQLTAEPGDFHNPGLLRPREPESSLPRVSSHLCAYGKILPGRNLDGVPNMIFVQSQVGVLSLPIFTNANQLFHVVPFSPSAAAFRPYRNGKAEIRLFSGEAATADAMRIEVCSQST